MPRQIARRIGADAKMLQNSGLMMIHHQDGSQAERRRGSRVEPSQDSERTAARKLQQRKYNSTYSKVEVFFVLVVTQRSGKRVDAHMSPMEPV